MVLGNPISFSIRVLLLVPLVCGCGRGVIHIKDNQYGGILVAIGDTVEENPKLVPRLKDVFIEASAYLYKITRKRAFFGNITILVPKSWSDKSYELQTRETIDNSDILVDHSYYGNRPFVVKCTPCGESGHHMHLTPDYVLDKTVAAEYGHYNKTLIHEWAHLRYGVFDEYPDVKTSQNFYAADNGEVEGIRCSSAVRGRFFDIVRQTTSCLFENGLPNGDCHFQPDTEEARSEYGSLLYSQRLDHITHFCDNDRSSPLTLHNRQAPNKQNKMCDGKSVWEVMREHPDFKDNSNPPRDVSSTVPTFRVVKEVTRRTVLVLDTSGSMEDHNRIQRLVRAASNYIRRVIMDGEELGVVWFSGTASTKANLTVINSSTRQKLLRHVPTTASGPTSIGAGLLEGLNVLQNASGKIILLSDGEETNPPYIEDVIQSVVDAGATVDTIAIGASADWKLEDVAQRTGGTSFYFSDSDTSNALNDAFITIAGRGKAIRDKAMQLFSESFLLGPGTTHDVTITLDSSIGLKTDITIGYSLLAPVVTVVTPGGRIVNQTSPEYGNDETFNTSNFRFEDLKETGDLILSIINPSSETQEVSLTVTTHIKNTTESPIVAHAQWRKSTIAYPFFQILFVSVSKGLSPVLHANVKAILERPGLVLGVPLILRDNGAGADVTKDDGIYSGYVTNFNGDGRYTARVTVEDDTTTVVDTGGFLGLGAASAGSLKTATEPVEHFRRFSTAGSFSLANFTASGDLLAPAKITDLAVSVLRLGQVILQWTAPGDDLDSGTAAMYKLWWSTGFDTIFDDHTLTSLVSDEMIVDGNLRQPSEAGRTEQAVISLPQDGDVTFYFVILSLDDANNTSPRSNIVSASMKYAEPLQNPQNMNIPLIAGMMIGGVALTLVVVAVAVAVHKRRTGAFLFTVNKKYHG